MKTVAPSETSEQDWQIGTLGHFRDADREREYTQTTWPHERQQLARFIILVSTLQLLFAVGVIAEYGLDWRFYAGLGLRLCASLVWLYPLWLTRQNHVPAHFNVALYGATLFELLILLWDGAFVYLGDLDYGTNVMLEVLVVTMLFYRSPRYLIGLLGAHLLAFLIFYLGLHQQLEYLRTAAFTSVLSILGVASAVYRVVLEHRLFLTNRMLQQHEKLNLVAVERQRLAQEMHDGLGGQLIGALNSFQCGTLTVHDAEQILLSCIDDMRLVVDAISPTDSDLLSTLGNLRYRLESRLNQTGIMLYWKIGNVPDSISMPPDRVLHVLRITQEALTNVLKHACANTVVVTLEVLGSNEFCIEISDDGIGNTLEITPNGTQGKHGWVNMQNRAISLHGQVAFIANATRGISIRLTFPLPTPNSQLPTPNSQLPK
jgi:signal transduction histidine kinase